MDNYTPGQMPNDENNQQTYSGGPVYYSNGPQPVYPQPPQYAPPQSYYYPPAYALRPRRDPWARAAGKTFNRLCLTVLLQTAVSFALSFAGSLLLLAVGANIYIDDLAYQLLSAFIVPISTTMPFVVYMFLSRQRVEDCIKVEKTGIFFSLLLVLTGLGICMLANFPAYFVQEFMSKFGYTPLSSADEQSSSLIVFVLELLSTAVLVPVMEEIAFRGIFLSSMRRYGNGFAIIGSSMVFALVHLDFSNVVFAFIAGLTFGFIYAKTENLWLTIAIHALNNAISVIGSYGDMLFGDYANVVSAAMMYIPIALGLLAIIILFALHGFKQRILFHGPYDRRMFRPLSSGEAAGAIVRAPLFWVVVAIMLVYTAMLFI